MGGRKVLDSPMKNFSLSFEFSPPKNPDAEAALWQTVNTLEGFRPDFVSVTYGAGGTTRERTHNCVKRLVADFNLPTAAHLTCVNASRAEIDTIIDDYVAAGVDHIVALRGDMPNFAPYEAHPHGYQSTGELVAAIRSRGVRNVSVSAYPEKHPESPSVAHDVELLRAKVEAGANRAITQFCFDDAALLGFRDAAVKAGIDVPILPGIMPTTNFAGAFRMAEKCGASVPDQLRAKFSGVGDDVVSRRAVALEVALAQCKLLLREGFNGVHIYTLNQAEFASQLSLALGQEVNNVDA